jgi:hypothetical protein
MCPDGIRASGKHIVESCQHVITGMEQALETLSLKHAILQEGEAFGLQTWRCLAPRTSGAEGAGDPHCGHVCCQKPAPAVHEWQPPYARSPGVSSQKSVDVKS